ncbi:restriction endonuclease [Alistipes sp. An116]|uniref:BglII/BstYI family type II restriction endonuclease n=1 Tax=Alistipes sp. An116 TaxID=1965546 RepID=UPI000B3A2A64|nr:BglII/BstYI family type II restriction endonuclease [Alistipes sp. An116]OUQ53276.1 restriction endonuclease [Alistipes sp. An116]
MANYIREQLLSKYEFLNFGHALEILSEAFPNEWQEIQDCLEQLVISTEDITSAGGNETAIPKKFDDFLYPRGWKELRITGDLLVKIYPRRANQRGRFTDEPFDQKIIEGYIDGHNIDFIKGRVAFDLEWNSKDQTFDRDLLALRTYFDCGLIDVGLIVTRSKELNDIFKNLQDRQGNPLIKKYGASTTWLGKLEYRLKSRRNGGCPVLAVGIKKACVEGYE